MLPPHSAFQSLLFHGFTWPGKMLLELLNVQIRRRFHHAACRKPILPSAMRTSHHGVLYTMHLSRERVLQDHRALEQL